MLTCITVFITLGLPSLYGRAKALGRVDSSFQWVWVPKPYLKKLLVACMFTLYSACSLFVIGTFPITPFSGSIPSWIIPTIVGLTLLLGVVYYFAVFWASASQDPAQKEHGSSAPSVRDHLSLLRLAGVKSKITKAANFDIEHDKRARRFGLRRRVEYEVKLPPSMS